MRCMYSNKNEATKSYERRVNGKRAQEYYGIECYEQLFLDGEGLKTDPSLSACPYCGTTLAEFKASSLVGCPYCYRTLLSEIAPFNCSGVILKSFSAKVSIITGFPPAISTIGS